MAIYHLSIKTIARGEGRSSVAAAAYRAGIKLVDERTGLTHDFSRKRDVLSAHMLLPAGGWMDRGEFWNKLEAHHKREKAITAREIEAALPAELMPEQRENLAKKFASEVAEKYGVAVDLAMHAARKPNSREAQTHAALPSNDSNNNWHCHLMLSACRVDASGNLGKKAEELDPIHCKRRKLETLADWSRNRWAELTNEALEAAQSTARVDHRSHKERGIPSAPSKHLGPAASAMKRRGIKSRRQLDQEKANSDAEQLTNFSKAVSAQELVTELELTETKSKRTVSRIRARGTEIQNQMALDARGIEAETASHIGYVRGGYAAAKPAQLALANLKPWKAPSGDVVYLKPQRDLQGKRAAFSDKGDRVNLHMQDKESMRAALLLASRKWPDGVLIKGSKEFREAATQEAISMGIKLHNAPAPDALPTPGHFKLPRPR